MQAAAEKMLGKRFVNKPETDDEGVMCNCLYILEELDVAKEIYLQIENDVKLSMPVITYSCHGGQSLERIQDLYPESIHQIAIDIQKGIVLSELLEVAQHLGVHYTK